MNYKALRTKRRWQMKGLTTVFILFFSINIWAQSENDPIFKPVPFPNAPNSALLGKFGNYGVSYFSGVPQISVPVYEIQAGSLQVPISFDYHASGIKVTDAASWVGLGWGLNAGGQISRVVKGRPDENGYLTGDMRPAANINRNSAAGQAYIYDVCASNVDAEPDVFSYDFGGKSGKFFFNRLNGYQPAIIPYAPISIKYDASLHFTITDEKGNLFLFGQAGETTTTIINGVGTSVVSSWKLDKIISADKRDTVTFKYTAQYAQTYHDVYDIFTIDDHIQPGATNESYPFVQYHNNSGVWTLGETMSYTNEQVLQEIDYPNGKVVFDLSASSRQDIPALKSLATIKVYGYDQNTNQFSLLKTFVPYQSYFIQGTDANTKRLRFDSLHINDANGSMVENYRFGYNTLMLPATTTKQKDFWGYYNGKANDYLVPQQTIQYGVNAVGGTDYNMTIGSSIANGRNPDSNYNQACVLNRIYFPTGGYTDFTYETNRFPSPFTGLDSLAGGLRIRKISSYDGVSSMPIVKSYKYNAARANYQLSNYYFSTTQSYIYWIPGGPWGTTPNATKRVRTYLSSPTIDIVPYDGTPVVYPQVTEYDGDSASNTGKTVYEFTDYPDVLQSASSVRPVVVSYFYRRGQLTNKTVYRNNGGGIYQPLLKETNNYTAFPATTYGPVGTVARQNTVNEGSGTSDTTVIAYQYNFDSYGIDADDNYLTSKTSYVYDQFDSTKYTAQTINYTYGNITHQQVTKTKTLNSKGDTLVSVNKYPADYIVSGSSTGNAVLDSMLLHNMHAVQIEQWDSVKSVSGIASLSGVTGGLISVYKQLATGVYKPDYTSKLEIATPLKNFVPSNIGSGQLQYDGRYKPLINFTTYDANRNIVEFKARNADTLSAIWDHKGTLPIAKVENAKYTKIAYTSFEADGTGNWNIGSSLRYTDRAVNGTMAYNLTNGNISKSTGLATSDSLIVSYWSTNNAYTVSGSISSITGKTISMNGVSWTYYEHTVTGVSTVTVSPVNGAAGTQNGIDELRLYPKRAQMTTFTYAPQIGITSQCDINNRITYYEYDSYNRLSIIRDQDRNVLKKICYNYYNQPDACDNSPAPPAPITISGINNASSVTFTATYTNTATSAVTSFDIAPTSGTVLGTLPAGIYNITITKKIGLTASHVFSACSIGATATGTSATFYNISVSTADCNTINIDGAL